MPDKRKSFVVAYAFLVVLPLLGLAATLNYGHRLNAPISVDGVWHFETSSNGLGHLLCGEVSVPVRDGSVLISQSGKTLMLNVDGDPKSATMGSIEGNAITATMMLSAGSRQSAGCGNDRRLILSATVAPGAVPRFLVGVLTLKDCASCAAVEFHAVRMVRAINKEEH